MLKANIQFYDIEEFGFFKRKRDKPSFGEPVEFFSDFDRWLASQSALGSTLVTNDRPSSTVSGQTYCKDFYRCEDTGDYVLILWNEVANGDGKVLAVPKTSPLGDSKVSEAKAGKDDILGLPSYFWFLTEYNSFASIRFTHSHQSIPTLQHYLKSYAENLSGYRLFDKDDNVVGYRDGESSERCSWFRFNYCKKLNKRERQKLLQHPERITALVRKAELPKVVPDRRGAVAQGFDALRERISGMVPAGWVDKEDDKDGYSARIDKMLNQAGVQKVSVEIPFVADEEMLKFLVEEFDQNFEEGGFDKVGFKMKGRSPVVWLGDSSIKTEVELDVNASRSQLPTAVEIMEALNKRRNFLLSLIDEESLTARAV